MSVFSNDTPFPYQPCLVQRGTLPDAQESKGKLPTAQESEDAYAQESEDA